MQAPLTAPQTLCQPPTPPPNKEAIRIVSFPKSGRGTFPFILRRTLSTQLNLSSPLDIMVNQFGIPRIKQPQHGYIPLTSWG